MISPFHKPRLKNNDDVKGIPNSASLMGTDTLVMYPKTAQYYLGTIRAIHKELDSTFDNKSTLNIKGLAKDHQIVIACDMHITNG